MNNKPWVKIVQTNQVGQIVCQDGVRGTLVQLEEGARVWVGGGTQLSFVYLTNKELIPIQERVEGEVLSIILDQSDGPVTNFVKICRAIELAREQKFDSITCADPIAEALAKALEMGELPSLERA